MGQSSGGVGRPEKSEYGGHFGNYIDLVPEEDIVESLATHRSDSFFALRELSPEASLHRPGPGKWSAREMLGHVIDTERIFAYRALRFARNDRTDLPGFEQDDYVAASRFDAREWSDLLDELDLVRRADVRMLRGLEPEAWSRRGVASGTGMTVRALAYAILGHERHHAKRLRASLAASGHLA